MKNQYSNSGIIQLLADEGIKTEYIGGELMALCRMSDWKGNDCSEWIPASEMVACLRSN